MPRIPMSSGIICTTSTWTESISIIGVRPQHMDMVLHPSIHTGAVTGGQAWFRRHIQIHNETSIVDSHSPGDIVRSTKGGDIGTVAKVQSVSTWNMDTIYKYSMTYFVALANAIRLRPANTDLMFAFGENRCWWCCNVTWREKRQADNLRESWKIFRLIMRMHSGQINFFSLELLIAPVCRQYQDT